MDRVGLDTPFVWVDVEPYEVAPWTSKRKRNKAVLDGVLRGYTDAGKEVGLYTSPGRGATSSALPATACRVAHRRWASLVEHRLFRCPAHVQGHLGAGRTDPVGAMVGHQAGLRSAV